MMQVLQMSVFAKRDLSAVRSEAQTLSRAEASGSGSECKTAGQLWTTMGLSFKLRERGKEACH